MSNKYAGKCHACGCSVSAGQGKLERHGRKWLVWCMRCFNASDNSGEEDRCCGNRAYEDQCARQCGYEMYGGDYEDVF